MPPSPPAPASSAIGIVRLSGPDSLSAVEKLFTPASGRKVSQYPVGTLIYGTLRDDKGRVLDGAWSPGPRPPQLHRGGHGGAPVPRRPRRCSPLALEALFALGGAAGRAGEFTRRAFLNGQLDLDPGGGGRIDLIDAETPAAAGYAAGQLSGAP